MEETAKEPIKPYEMDESAVIEIKKFVDINEHALITFPLHVDENFGMFLAAESSRYYTTDAIDERESTLQIVFPDAKYQRSRVEDFLSFLSTRNISQKDYERMCIKVKAKWIFWFYERKREVNAQKMIHTDMVVLHKRTGLIPAFRCNPFVKYPSIYIFDDGKRFYGVKSVEDLYNCIEFCNLCGAVDESKYHSFQDCLDVYDAEMKSEMENKVAKAPKRKYSTNASPFHPFKKS